ncbi:uncharacterized protein LOC128961681 [Oppia nitens]|uniref:uncharacterized protein LOC128961681 n=1 Tax=Oppia nitens TaxID=1686743 RepID=UPI0023DBB09B|nr:uncharacterized protein LOC128961681 [Oppia nitens]
MVKKEKIIVKRPEFYVFALLVVITMAIITLIVAINVYIWNKVIDFGDNGWRFSSRLIVYHPYIMTTFLIICGHSLLVHRIGFSLRISARLMRIIHASLNVMTMLLGLCPIYTITHAFWTHRIAKPFYSIHCWIGVITLIAYICQIFVTLSYYSLSSTTPQMTISYESTHKLIGYALICMISLTCIIGISEKMPIIF